MASAAEQALWRKLAAERRRSEKLEIEISAQFKLIADISGERYMLKRELEAIQPWLLWMAQRINYFEKTISTEQSCCGEVK